MVSIRAISPLPAPRSVRLLVVLPELGVIVKGLVNLSNPVPEAVIVWSEPLLNWTLITRSVVSPGPV